MEPLPDGGPLDEPAPGELEEVGPGGLIDDAMARLVRSERVVRVRMAQRMGKQRLLPVVQVGLTEATFRLDNLPGFPAQMCRFANPSCQSDSR